MDDDCGQGQSCEQGFCGGPPDTAAADSGSTTGGSTTTGDGTTSGTTAVDGSSSGTPEAVCGNEIVEDGEECDEGKEGDEECDADCTAVECGDGVVNTLAGEQCDEPDGDEPSCTEYCTETLFFDDMEDPGESAELWATTIPAFPGIDGDYQIEVEGWVLGGGGGGPGAWSSGMYSEMPGAAMLSTVPIEFPDELPDDFHYEVHFSHSIRFDGNGMIDADCGTLFGDGGVVWLMPSGGGMQMPQTIGPPMGTPTELDDSGGCVATGENPNPLYSDAMPSPAYVGTTPGGFQDVVLELDDSVAGNTYHIIFVMSYDCSNCWQGVFPTGMPPVGWIVDDVVVAAYPDR
ncbi:MAG: hypothetical protein AAF799_38295 [Myxococcota bacterium]